MIRDPYYNQIVEGLARPRDGQIFEHCVANLLRIPFPGTVPVPGGSDSGMDGGVPDGDGLAYPLVTTTSGKVIDNLTRNLRQYLRNGGERRKVLLATSQSLTARKRRNLEDRAKELGFVLIQIYDRTAVADLLYRDSHWCRELLGLSGAPPALSDIPRGQRPFPEQPLIGRESDLHWLTAATGDVLLIGQPGCGKTSILRALAQQGVGLFVNSDNLEAIANGIREHQPTALFLDDAHTDLDTLRGLQALRNEMRHQFRIIATSWPGASPTVSERMSLPSHTVRTLELLNRDQVAKVVEAASVPGPTWLVAQIVTQAAGRPGLAATLAFLCRQGDIHDVLTGDALVRFVGPSLEGLVGRHALTVLAAFALGGDAGMPLDEVANLLGLSPLDATRLVRDLSAAGVITEERTGNLSVIPYALRHVLVRDQFFAGSSALPFPALLSHAPRLRDALLTLIGARSAGAAIPDVFLLRHLDELGGAEAWEAFAGLGPEQAEEVLERYQNDPTLVAAPLLAHVPEFVIPALLTAASGGPWFPRPAHRRIRWPMVPPPCSPPHQVAHGSCTTCRRR